MQRVTGGELEWCIQEWLRKIQNSHNGHHTTSKMDVTPGNPGKIEILKMITWSIIQGLNCLWANPRDVGRGECRQFLVNCQTGVVWVMGWRQLFILCTNCKAKDDCACCPAPALWNQLPQHIRNVDSVDWDPPLYKCLLLYHLALLGFGPFSMCSIWLIGVVSAVVQTLYWSVLVKRELSQMASVSLYRLIWSIFGPALMVINYG